MDEDYRWFHKSNWYYRKVIHLNCKEEQVWWQIVQLFHISSIFLEILECALFDSLLLWVLDLIVSSIVKLCSQWLFARVLQDRPSAHLLTFGWTASEGHFYFSILNTWCIGGSDDKMQFDWSCPILDMRTRLGWTMYRTLARRLPKGQ